MDHKLWSINTSLNTYGWTTSILMTDVVEFFKVTNIILTDDSTVNSNMLTIYDPWLHMSFDHISLSQPYETIQT